VRNVNPYIPLREAQPDGPLSGSLETPLHVQQWRIADVPCPTSAFGRNRTVCFLVLDVESRRSRKPTA
jgi:hypothetical protein